MSDSSIRVLLLRHAQVASHRGDVPITEEGHALSTEVGRRLGEQHPVIRLLSSATLRARQTAEAIREGARESGALVSGPETAFALRNPDLYVAGQRVDMVSSPEALAEQLHGIDATAAARVPFFAGFLTEQDRIGWWLRHPSPPGDDAAAVVRRIDAFAASLRDHPDDVGLTVGITHSPLLRALGARILDDDPGEPDFVSGVGIEVLEDRSVHLTWLDGAP